MCCAYVRKIHCPVVDSCYASGRPCTEHQPMSRSRRFTKGWATFGEVGLFHREGASPTNHCWCQKTGVIVLSCSIKICAVHHLVLSQYTHLTDGQTDRIATAKPEVKLHAHVYITSGYVSERICFLANCISVPNVIKI